MLMKVSSTPAKKALDLDNVVGGEDDGDEEGEDDVDEDGDEDVEVDTGEPLHRRAVLRDREERREHVVPVDQREQALRRGQDVLELERKRAGSRRKSKTKVGKTLME